MLSYLAKKLIESLIILFTLSIVIYYMLGLMPGDPIELLITSRPNIKTEDIARLKKIYGLDQPI